jgi:hypothetical protein
VSLLRSKNCESPERGRGGGDVGHVGGGGDSKVSFAARGGGLISKPD